MNELPTPSAEATARSEQLGAEIRKTILASGPISFAHFMQMALYQPELGYYSGPAEKFGRAGDFITAPMVSPLFSRCIARQCQQVLLQLKTPCLLEFGAGTGDMALALLRELDELGCLPSTYYIVEISADLRARQRQLFEAQGPDYLARLVWLEQLPDSPFDGVIIANEVLDAMPAHLFKQSDSLLEYFIDWRDNQFCGDYLASNNKALQQAVQALDVELPLGYCSEINLALESWVQSIANSITRGLVLLIDYGYERAAYYHPERDQGTLICHYQQRAHDDPLIFPGIQDITANVDFTAVAESAVAADLHIGGYVHQAGFLMNCGLMGMIPPDLPPIDQYALAQQVKKLTLPGEMGERFKVIGLVKEFDDPLLGFTQFDQLGRL